MTQTGLNVVQFALPLLMYVINNLTKLVTTSKEKRSAGTKTGKPTQKSGSFCQNTPITAYSSRIDDICGSSLGHEDRDVAPKNSVTVDASNSSHSQVHVSGSMCSSSSNWGPLSPYPYHLHPHISPYNSSYGYHPDSQPFGSFGPFPPNAPVVSPIPQSYSWSVPSFSTRSQGEAEQRAYIVKLLNNRIKKCCGCGTAFLRKVDGSPPEPPNLVICHEERCPIF